MKSYTFNTKTNFPSRTFYKIIFFKIFPKCSLDVPNIVTLREHSANIPGISRAVWEAVAQRCSVKKMFLEILQNSQENTCVRVSF